MEDARMTMMGSLEVVQWPEALMKLVEGLDSTDPIIKVVSLFNPALVNEMY